MDMSPKGIKGQSIGRQEDRGISKGSLSPEFVSKLTTIALLNLNKEIDIRSVFSNSQLLPELATS